MDTINIECKKFVEQNFKIQTCSEFFQRIYANYKPSQNGAKKCW